jgi:hypothetical protein
MPRARFVIGLISILFVSCDPFAPPIEYVSVVPVSGDRGALHARAGITYAVTNVSGKEITWFQIAFDLYDENARPLPEQGGNSFYADVSTSLAAGATVTLVTSLDDVFAAQPGPFAVSRFRVATAAFADGSRWSNIVGHVYEAAE